MRRTMKLAAALLALTAPAAAQAPFQADFQFQLAGPQYDQYTGNLDGGSFFQVFCVQPFQYVGNNEVYGDAWITPLASADLSHILNGTGQMPGNSGFTNAPDQYLAAAQIASIMGSGVWGLPDVRNIQYAIWSAMGFDVTNYGGYDQVRVDFFTTEAGEAPSVSAKNWAVVTDNRQRRQEFIYQLPDTPQEVVPEPATMTLLATGLVGMAAARRKRRRG